MRKIEKVDEHLQGKLKDPYFREQYELEAQKLEIAKRIVSYRVKKGINQAQLAKAARVTQQHISKIERGEFSSVATLHKILFFIGYTVRIKAIPLSKNTAKHHLPKI